MKRFALASLLFAAAGSALAAVPLPKPSGDPMADIRALLRHHHETERIDARAFGLPQDDFDDATNITIDERRAFRALYPDTGEAGTYQYPRWAYDYLHRMFGLEPEEGGDPYRASVLAATADALGLPVGLTAVLVGPNVNVTANGGKESETYLAVDPNDPRYLVGSSNDLSGSAQAMFRSSDWGATWARNTLPLSCSRHSDPTNAFDSSSNVFSATLDYGGGSCGTKLNVYRSTDHGATWSAGKAIDSNSANDKELMTVDYQAASPCRDTIYVGWDASGNEKVAAAAAGAYTGAWKITASLDSNAIGTDLAVGPDGEAYTSWANTTTRAINVSKSVNCGQNWSTRKAVASTTDSYDYGIPAMCDRRALIYPSIDVDRSAGPRRGWAYVVWNDFSASQSSGCVAASTTATADIWFSRSTDGAVSWSPKTKIHADVAKTDQFNQWMRVDDVDGTIHASWNDTRNDPVGREKTDIYYTRSTDGGTTWETETRVTNETTDESTTSADPNQYGDYAGLAVRAGVVWPFWTDRRLSSGTDEEVFAAKICSEPREIARPSAVDSSPCTAGFADVAWTAPSVFWGDAGSGSRSFEVLVDGASTGPIAEGTLGTSVPTGVAGLHTISIRATNGCGVVTDGAGVSVDDVVGAGPSISANPDTTVGCIGNPMTFSVTASPGSSYQWYHDGNPVGGATLATYTVPSVTAADAGDWSVEVSNGCGGLTAGPTTVSLHPLPAPVPTAPTLDVPTGATDTTLSWTPGTDNARFWIYLGETNPPPFYREQGGSKTTLPIRLAPGAAYYWKVAAYPPSGAAAAAATPVSGFTTNPNGTSISAISPLVVDRWGGAITLTFDGTNLPTASPSVGFRGATALPGVFTPASATAQQLSGSFAPDAAAPAGLYDVLLEDGGVESTTRLQAIAIRAFADVQPTDWWAEPADRTVTAGIFDSFTGPSGPEFHGSSVVSRGDMAEAMVRAHFWKLGQTVPVRACSSYFPDVPCSHAQVVFIEWARDLGVTLGTAEGTFLPDANVTRAEMAAFLDRLKYGGDAHVPKCYPDPGWSDLASIPSWAQPYVHLLRADRTTAGCTASPLAYCALSAVQRADLSTFLARAVGLVPLP